MERRKIASQKRGAMKKSRCLPLRSGIVTVCYCMKFTYNWLKQYVDFDWSPQESMDVTI